MYAMRPEGDDALVVEQELVDLAIAGVVRLEARVGREVGPVE